MRPNVSTPEGRALETEVARLCDQEAVAKGVGPLPCPKCRSDDSGELDEENDGRWTVWCNLSGCGYEVTADTEAEAIAAWNRRASPPPPAAEAVREAHRMVTWEVSHARREDRQGDADNLLVIQRKLEAALTAAPPQGERCDRCRGPMPPHDLTLAKADWLAIHPEDGGVLCPNCMVTLAGELPDAINITGKIARAADFEDGPIKAVFAPLHEPPQPDSATGPGWSA